MPLVLLNPLIGSLPYATASGQSWPGSNSNKEFLCIPYSSSITWTSLLDCLVSYLGHSLVAGGVLLCGRGAVVVFYGPSWLGRQCFMKGQKLEGKKPDSHGHGSVFETGVGWIFSLRATMSPRKMKGNFLLAK